MNSANISPAIMYVCSSTCSCNMKTLYIIVAKNKRNTYNISIYTNDNPSPKYIFAGTRMMVATAFNDMEVANIAKNVLCIAACKK